MRSLLKFGWCSIVLGFAIAAIGLPTKAACQDQDQDDPPGRVARLGYLQGSISLQPAGENDWVGAVPNRPMTTGDKLWADQDSRAEVQLGSAVIRLAPNTGFSFLNLDDNTVQIQLTSGAISVTVRQLNDGDDFEVDTPNLAFTVSRPGHYRVEASEDGSHTSISIREGDGEATGNGQTYTLHRGQRGTFSGTDSLNADVEQIGGLDDFDTWAESRDHRYDSSRSAHYLSPDVVGYEDLDDYGDWRDDSNYGHVWFPNQVAVGWAPYHEGHWDWISPWGWTWVDDSPWGYAPFHYGRWVSVGGRWGWVAGPAAVRPVYAPALVVFIGGGPGGFGGNVGWFPLGPREVYVPSYRVSRAYVNRVNVSNTNVNVIQVTNVYNTTIVHNTVNITNVTYVNRNVHGAVTAVPQRTFASAQPVARAAVAMNSRDIAAASVSARVAVAPTRESVLGAKASSANRVAAPPAAVASRQVVAKRTPPPPPVPFMKQQQALASHPGQPLARSEVQSLRPANPAAAQPMVRQAPPGRAATPSFGRPENRPAPNGRPAPEPNRPTPPQPSNRPTSPLPNNRPTPPQPNNQPTPPQPNNRPTSPPPNNRPTPPQPNNRPERGSPVYRPPVTPNQPAPNRVPVPPQPNNRPMPTPPANPPETYRQPQSQPMNPSSAPRPAAQPPAHNDRPPAAQPNYRPAPNRTAPVPRPQTSTERPQERGAPPAAAKPAPAPPQQPRPQTPAEKKRQEQEKPPGD
jgi:hypothetical protein